jgi:hypothetical protein
MHVAPLAFLAVSKALLAQPTLAVQEIDADQVVCSASKRTQSAVTRPLVLSAVDLSNDLF